MTMENRTEQEANVMRLDQLSEIELHKLYVRSCYLSQIGTLIFGFSIIFTIATCFYLLSAPFMALLILPFYAEAYVFKYVRTPAARVLFYIASISGIVLSLAGLVTQLVTGLSLIIVIPVITLLINVEVFKSARTDVLFGQNHFTHKQIALARRKQRMKESFTDEELPVSYPGKILSWICIVLSYLLIILEVCVVIGVSKDNIILQKADTAFENKDYTQAVKWYEKIDVKGADTQEILAHCYLQCSEKEKDPAEAVKYLRKAADMGHAGGQAKLGVCYLEGIGVEKNEKTAFELFRKSADQGNAEGETGLGLCYLQGFGVEKNFDEAVKWFQKAAEQGDKTARDVLQKIEQAKIY